MNEIREVASILPVPGFRVYLFTDLWDGVTLLIDMIMTCQLYLYPTKD